MGVDYNTAVAAAGFVPGSKTASDTAALITALSAGAGFALYDCLQATNAGGNFSVPDVMGNAPPAAAVGTRAPSIGTGGVLTFVKANANIINTAASAVFALNSACSFFIIGTSIASNANMWANIGPSGGGTTAMLGHWNETTAYGVRGGANSVQLPGNGAAGGTTVRLLIASVSGTTLTCGNPNDVATTTAVTANGSGSNVLTIGAFQPGLASASCSACTVNYFGFIPRVVTTPDTTALVTLLAARGGSHF